jgi:YggT family protein
VLEGSHANRDRAVNPYLAYWWFHLPNFILSALMYTVLGRVLLGLMVDPQSKNYIWRAFVRITDPVVRAVAFITPRAVPPVIVLLFTAVWLLLARMVLLVIVINSGFTPAAGVAAP